MFHSLGNKMTIYKILQVFKHGGSVIHIQIYKSALKNQYYIPMLRCMMKVLNDSETLISHHLNCGDNFSHAVSMFFFVSWRHLVIM